MKQFTVVTLFPELFPGPLGVGVVGRGLEQDLLSIDTVSIREHGIGKHKIVDDTPYGGGSGMVMKAEPVIAALQDAQSQAPEGTLTYYMSPQGAPLTQSMVRSFAQAPGLILLCGRYEGIDERAMAYVDGQCSIGDYVISGGEIAAMIVIDAVARLIPGVLGNPDSLAEESFGKPADESDPTGLLEYPQYTRPRHHLGQDVPEVLLSGNHELIRKWRLRQSLRRTLAQRPDLLAPEHLTKEAQDMLEEIRAQQKQEETP